MTIKERCEELHGDLQNRMGLMDDTTNECVNVRHGRPDKELCRRIRDWARQLLEQMTEAAK